MQHTHLGSGPCLALCQLTVLLYPVEVRSELEKAVNRDDIAVILITETLVSLCPDLIYDLKLNRKQPLIVEIPDRHGNGRTKDSITKYVQDAIGVKL